MAIPAQVKNESQESEKLLELFNEKTEKKGEVKPEGEIENKPTAPEETKPEEKASDSDVKPEVKVEIEQPASKDWEKEFKAVEHKYKVLQGKYNAEIPRAYADVAKANAENVKLKSSLAEYINKFNQPNAAPDTKVDDVEDTLDADTRAVIDKRVEARVKDIESRFEKMIEPLHAKINVAEENTIESYLDKHAPNWKQKNFDSEFATWLDTTVAPFTRNKMREILNYSYKTRDMEQLAQIFNAFNASSTPNPATNAPVTDKKEKLKAMVSPSKSQPTNRVASEAESFTSEQIEKFYFDVSQGKYKGKGKEKEDMELKINAFLDSARAV